jgi:hypothetical protein
MVAAYPMGPIMEGVGLNITVFSYRGSVDFGFMVDRELVPNVWDMADRVKDALAELQQAAGLAPAKAARAAKTPKAPAKATKKAAANGDGAPAVRKAPLRPEAAAAAKAPRRKAATPRS